HPNKAVGLSQSIPKYPWLTIDEFSRPAPAREGKSRVNIQQIKPILSPARAPFLEAPFQYKPPKTEGASCATAAKDTSPIDTKEYCSATILSYASARPITSSILPLRTQSTMEEKSGAG